MPGNDEQRTLDGGTRAFRSKQHICEVGLLFLVFIFALLDLAGCSAHADAAAAAPRRAGNALNDAFAIFPHVEPQQRLKKLLYQGLGVALVLVSLFYIRQIYIGLALPIAHFLKK